MYRSTNHWADPEYKGINTRWITQQGQRFEVQFHTPESFHAKEILTHKAYERIRDTTTRMASPEGWSMTTVRPMRPCGETLAGRPHR
jgi:hypothetical protein